jgi:cyclic beta-1,2-glucan synthetase
MLIHCRIISLLAALLTHALNTTAANRSSELASPVDSGGFGFGNASATLEKDGRFPVRLNYSVGSGGGAGVWIRYQPGLKSSGINRVFVSNDFGEPRQRENVKVKAELKGTAGVQTIALGTNRVDAEVAWDQIGDFKEAVLVVTRKGGPDPVVGSLSGGFTFYRQRVELKKDPDAFKRFGTAAAIALIFGSLFGIGRSKYEARAAEGFKRDILLGSAFALLGWIILMVISGSAAVIAVTIAGVAVGQLLKLAFVGGRLSRAEAFANALITGVLAASATDLPLLQIPTSLAAVFRLNLFTASVFIGVHFIANTWQLASRHRHLSGPASGIVLAVPFLFSSLLLLNSQLGEGVIAGILIVFVFNEAVAQAISLATRGKIITDIRTHSMFLLAALAVNASPFVAHVGSGGWSAQLGGLSLFGVTILSTILSQAGLWVEAYLLTGMLMDGIHGRAPETATTTRHIGTGAGKGMVYSGVFMAILHGLHAAIKSGIFANATWLIAIGFGALTFPLLKTVIETFDGSTAFFRRLQKSYQHPWHYLRGAVIGGGAAMAINADLFHAATDRRILIGLTIGLLAAGGVSLVRDFVNQSRKRGRIRSSRAYLVDSLMGGFIGAALGFYLDAAQVTVVINKFQQYVSVGQPTADYTTMPFLNRWGILSLGSYTGGVSLLFCEALAGVLNWSIAAWLFAINRTFLSAVLDRNMAPIKFLFSREGFIQLIQHMIEVMRWGLWMSPIIFSFLRMMGEPTWYNQDGAIRTAIATFNSFTMSDVDFTEWSIGVFIALLSYDAIRVLIWLDHMGLRVATLVNFSFLGMDKLDGWVSRFIGKDATARYIPEGVKRFTTWAPLLIPFYIPRGNDWDRAWEQSLAIKEANADTGIIAWFAGQPAFSQALVALAAMPILTLTIALIRKVRDRNKQTDTGTHTLANREYAVVLRDSGECFSRLPKEGYDVTRRAYDHRSPSGRALFIADGKRHWPVIGNHPEAVYEINEGSDSLSIVTTNDQVRSTLRITLPTADDSVELWELTVENLADQRRHLSIVPYLEWNLNNPDGDRGHTQYNRLFPEVSYATEMNAVVALHRYTRISGFLASELAPTGFLDSRIDFIGRGQSLWSPRILQTMAFREPADTNPSPTFDSISSVRVELSLAAKATGKLRFLVGCTAENSEVGKLIQRHLNPIAGQAAAVQRRTPLIGHGEIHPDTPHPYFEYRDNGNTLRLLTPFTPRPWDHSMSNSLGHVLCVTNRGLHTTANGNSQQNRVTPDWADTTTQEIPVEAIYLQDLDNEERYSPTWHPLNDPAASYTTDFSIDGTACFHMTKGNVQTELTTFVPLDHPVGIYLLTIRNTGDKRMRLRVAPYFQIALADMPENAGPLKIDHDRSTDAVYFENPRNTFRQGTAFVATTQAAKQVDTRRGSFTGSNIQPDANDNTPVAAFTVEIEVPANGESTIAAMLGQADSAELARRTVDHFKNLDNVHQALADTRKWWTALSTTALVETSDNTFDEHLNWLKYQALAERIWARRGFYQSSGAFGFRDQLQDSVNMIWVDPTLARNQIQLHAAQQFLEGDVVHWFFRQQDGRTGFACRSHAYDNLLWLTWGVAEYVRMTGDQALLDISVPYLDAEQPLTPLPEGKHGMGFFPLRSNVSESIYAHCLRAFDLVFEKRLGPHGLPLIGAGDWNDGLDEIGSEGRGESTWLGFFLHSILRDFIPLIEAREGKAQADRYRTRMTKLRESLEGTWREDRYLRAIHDDGTEIGVKGSGVWEIDALTAAWSVMSGVNPARGRIVFDTAVRELEREKVVLLGTPALREDTKPYLGRSSRYPEGVRENGMYCHGDQWLVKAARVLTEQCMAAGADEAAAHYRATGYRIWRKISPLSHTTPEEIEIYGGQPNKQAADILTTFDPGRMIWNGYTGAAAWMLREMFEGILGYELKNGELIAPDDLDQPRGDLQVVKVERKI